MASSRLKVFMKALRRLDKAGIPITSQALLKVVKIHETELSTPLDIAAGWISTFRRYGFLAVIKGEKVPGPKRQLQVYRLTEWGKKYRGKEETEELQIAANPGDDKE
jgi:hypothetical protein